MTAFLTSIFSFLWIHRGLKTSSTVPTPSSMTVPLTLLPVYLLCRQLKRTQYPTAYRWLPFWCCYPFTSWYVVSWNSPNTQPLIDDCPSNPDDIDLPPGRSSAETSTTSWEVISWDIHHSTRPLTDDCPSDFNILFPLDKQLPIYSSMCPYDVSIHLPPDMSSETSVPWNGRTHVRMDTPTQFWTQCSLWVLRNVLKNEIKSINVPTQKVTSL